jgi:hypothetical protein
MARSEDASSLLHRVAVPLKLDRLLDELQVAILSSSRRIPNFCLSSLAILRDTNGCLEFIPASDKMPDIVFGAIYRFHTCISASVRNSSLKFAHFAATSESRPADSSSSSPEPSKAATKVDRIDLFSAGHL